MLCYYSSIIRVNEKNYDFVVFVRKGIIKKRDLFDLFSAQLKFPSYFGNNWDALYDCLSDLNWIDNKSVLIFHEDIPLNTSNRDMEIYIKLIFDVEKTACNQYVKIDVAFPRNNRKEIESIINNV